MSVPFTVADGRFKVQTYVAECEQSFILLVTNRNNSMKLADCVDAFTLFWSVRLVLFLCHISYYNVGV